jgi:hypothetical protein
MIAVVGWILGDASRTPPAGLEPGEEIAQRIARLGGTVEMVSAVPEGLSGDVALQRLASAGIGHAATRRSAAASLDPADLELALRYLPDVSVIVLAADAIGLRSTAALAAGWSNAALVTIVPADAGEGKVSGPEAASLPGTEAGEASEIAFRAPERDPDGAFAGLVAALAIRLDAGEAAASAWEQVTRDLAVDEVSAPEPGQAALRD